MSTRRLVMSGRSRDSNKTIAGDYQGKNDSRDLATVVLLSRTLSSTVPKIGDKHLKGALHFRHRLVYAKRQANEALGANQRPRDANNTIGDCKTKYSQFYNAHPTSKMLNENESLCAQL